MYEFSKILEKSQKDVSRNIIFSEYSAQPLYRIIKQYYAEHPYASEQEVYKYFEDLFIGMNSEIARLPIMSIKNSTIEYNICKFLNKNDKERREYYEKVKREEEKKGSKIFEEKGLGTYSSNRLSSMRILTINALNELREAKKGCSAEQQKQIFVFKNLPKKVQSNYKNKLNSKVRKEFQYLMELFSGDEFSQYSNVLKRCEAAIATDLRRDYIESIIKLGERFKQFGLLETYSKNQDKLFERIGIQELTYPLRGNNEGTISVEQLFTIEVLENMPLNNLAMINTFWLNRYTKELESINRSFFIVKNLKLLGKIRDAVPEKDTGNIKISIEEDDLENTYKKMNFLHRVLKIIFKEVEKGKYKGIIEETVTETRKNTTKKVDIYPALEKLQESMGEEYRAHFSKTQPDVEHDLFTDADDYRIMENATHNTYMAKDMNIIAILSNLYEVGFSNNWGIIPERNWKNSNMILLGVDITGLNMPVRVHVEKSLVCDFLKGYQGNTLFPVYEGDKDFEHEFQVIPTQVLMPICEKQRKGLKTLIQKGNPYRKNLLEHLLFLSNGTYPEHLKVETTTKKKGKVKVSRKIPPRRYLDLLTGEEYVQNKNGEIEEVQKNITKTGEDR